MLSGAKVLQVRITLIITYLCERKKVYLLAVIIIILLMHKYG